MHHHTAIAEKFIANGRVSAVREFGNGNINDTYLVTTDNNEDNPFVLQRINTHVFKQPTLIMRNMRAFTDHMRRRARDQQYHWIMPRVLSATDGTESIESHEHDIRNIVHSIATRAA